MKKKTKLKICSIYFLSFLAPVLFMALIFKSQGIELNGQTTPLTYDLYAQYMPFIAGLRYILQDVRNLLFNWNVSLGGNNLGLFAYYMASPINWITVFFNLRDMPNAIYLISLTKIGLSGLTFFIYLRHGIKEGKTNTYWQLLFSICYALMSYNILYNMCLMWIDGVILLPIILLGVEKLLQGEKGFLYLISLTTLLYCNYYITYMVGLFIGSYFLITLITNTTSKNRKEQLHLLTKFLVNTILAFGLSMPLLLPTLLNLRLGKVQGTLNLSSNPYWGTIIDTLKKFLPFQFDGVNLGKPSIFCGSITIVFILVFFVQKRARIEKVSVGLWLIFLFMGFLLPSFDYLWNGLREPMGYLYRYAFVFSAAELIIAYHATIKLRIPSSKTWILFSLCSIYTIGELTVNGFCLVNGISQESPYVPQIAYTVINDLYEPIALEIKKNKEFYRVSSEQIYHSNNDAMMYGIVGTNYFSSVYNASIDKLLKNLGSSDDLSIVTNTSNAGPLLDSILGVKYRIGTSIPNGNYLEIYKTSLDTMALKLYENQSSLSLGTVSGASPEVFSLGNDVYANQNQMISLLLNEKIEIYKKIPCALTKGYDQTKYYEFLFAAPAFKDIYFFIDGYLNLNENANIFIDNVFYTEKGARNLRANCYLGQISEESSHTIRIDGNFNIFTDLYVYYFDQEAYDYAIQKLKCKQMNISEFKAGLVCGTVTSTDNEMLYTTIPYDEGFSVLVDGIKTDYQLWADAFICIPLENGEHTIKITYCPPGLILGFGIFFVSLIFTIFIFVPKGSLKHKLKDK